jgi:tetratricopeptide (TPR) repeat protein
MLTGKESTQQQLGYAITSREMQKFVHANRGMWSPETASEFLFRGEFFLNHGAPSLALIALDTSIRKQATVHAYQLRAEAKMALHQWESAHADLSLAEKLGKSDTQSHTVSLKAELAYHQGQFKSAAKLATKAIELDQKSALAYRIRAMVLLQENDLPGSFADLEKAHDLQIGSGKVYYQLGRWYEKKGEDENALAAMMRAFSSEPWSLEAARFQVNWYVQHKQWKKAIPIIESMLEFDPADSESLMQLGKCWFAQAEPNRAISPITHSLELDAKHRYSRLQWLESELRNRVAENPGEKEKWTNWYRAFLEKWIHRSRNIELHKRLQTLLDLLLSTSSFEKSLEGLKLLK